MGLVLYNFSLQNEHESYLTAEEFSRELSRHALLEFQMNEHRGVKEMYDGNKIEFCHYSFVASGFDFQSHKVAFSSHSVEVWKTDGGIGDYLYSCILYLFARQTINKGGGTVFDMFSQSDRPLYNEADLEQNVFYGLDEILERAKKPYSAE